MTSEESDTRSPTRFVVDASVGIKLFVEEPLSDRARRLFERPVVGDTGRLLVPDLFYAECANILWKYVRRFGRSVSEARRHMANIMKLELEHVRTAELAEDALPLALSHEISAYDACYAALAERSRAPLVTADRKLTRKLEGTGIDVRWLGEMPVGSADEA